MKIAISGSHGLIGSYIINEFRSNNHSVTRIVRSKKEIGIFWDPETNYINPNRLESQDVIINLCGDKISSLNPFKIKKDIIIASRVGTSLLLSRIISELKNPPKYFISASACGIYKPSTDVITENSLYGSGFLAQLVLNWEEASRFYEMPDTKIVNLRLGQVISQEGIFFKIMKNLVTYLKVSSIGPGSQYWPWISIRDVAGILNFIIESDYIEGPINIVSPQRVTAREFLRKLSKGTSSSRLFRVPNQIIKIGANELASQVLLNSYPVIPEKLQQNNYNFLDQDLSKVFDDLLKN